LCFKTKNTTKFTLMLVLAMQFSKGGGDRSPGSHRAGG
jgi:hypothetical protein